MTTKNQLALRLPRDHLAGIRANFLRQGVTELKIVFKNKCEIISGKMRDGTTIRVSTFDEGGYRERTVSRYEPQSATERRRQARRMYDEGLTQLEIAERLGCSQKTVSNDLRA